MSRLDDILDKSMYKQDFWTKEVKREMSDVEAREQIKALMLELIDEAGQYPGGAINETELRKKVNEL